MNYYGQKLQLDDLINSEWQKKFANPKQLAKSLKGTGISFVEFAIGEETDSDQYIKMSKIFSDEGLFVSLHPYLYKELSPEIFNKNKIPYLKKMLNAAQTISEITGFPVSYVFHGGRACWEPYFIDLEHAIFNAQSFFSWIDDACTNEFTSVIPLCETQTPWNERNDGMVRLGDTYKSCLDLVEHTDIGICWDFGHTHRSNFIGKQEELPDDYFLSRVQHVHAHDTFDVDGNQEDHFPLGDGVAPWRKYCAELARHQYDDSILLEINPSSRFKNLDELIFFAFDGIQRLRIFFEPPQNEENHIVEG